MNELFIDNVLKKELDKVKEVVTKRDRDFVMVVDGEEGCLSGDTEIQVSRFKLSRRYTIERLYNHYNNNPDKIIDKNKGFDLREPSRIRCFDGKEIRLHKIKSVFYSGIKEVYLLKLDNELIIKATKDHKFLTKDGWKELQNLSTEDSIMCDTPTTSKLYKIRHKFHDIQIGRLFYHPYTKPFINNKPKRIEVHRLIYEAYLNYLDFLEYINILSNDKDRSKTLKFVNPKINVVHHKDGNHYNNSKENLECLSKEEHQKLHGNYLYTNFNQGIPKFIKIKTITFFDNVKTYDIECEEPHHNFVANGIVVHNSGKSVLAMQIAKHLDKDFNIDKVTFNSDQFMNAIRNCNKYSCIVLDEAFTASNSRASLTEVNRAMCGIASEMRQRNLFIIMVIPSFFDLDKYFALWRCRALLHVYFKEDGNRGSYVIFPKSSKKMLYLTGKKFYNYSKPHSPLPPCKFYEYYPVDETEYRLRKAEAFRKRTVTNLARKWKGQRDALIKQLYHKLSFTTIQIARLFNDWGERTLSEREIQRIVQLDSNINIKDEEELEEPIKTIQEAV